MFGYTVFIISPTNVVVVVLPFVPVMAVIGQCVSVYANSTSLMTETPACSAFCIKSKSQGTPGLNTIKSCFCAISSGFFPVYSTTPFCSKSKAACGTSSRFFISCNVTTAHCFCNNVAAAIPLLAIPQTNACIPFRFISFPSFLKTYSYSPKIPPNKAKLLPHKTMSQLLFLSNHIVPNDDGMVPF